MQPDVTAQQSAFTNDARTLASVFCAYTVTATFWLLFATAVANSSQNVAVTVYAQNTDASVRASFVNADCCAVTSGCMAVSSCQRRMAHAAQLDQFRGRGLASPEGNPIEGTWENPQW